MAGRGGNKKEWVNVMRQEGLDDMVLVSEVTNEAIAKNLKVRYDKDIIYTNIGQVLISMNPYKWLEIYNDNLMDDYIGKPRIELPPHIFGVAEEAYRAMKNDNENQCVIISGESGAGKTEAAKKVMEYIAYASSNAPEVQRVKKIILATNPILESFGNAKTLRNDNSSRFGKYFEIQFNAVGDPIGGVISNFLLEKSRVVGQIDGERNFHIFYQITKGAKGKMANDLGLGDPRNFAYICGTTDVPTVDDLEWWAETQEACNFIGMSAQEQWELWSVLAAILWTGNIEFLEKGDSATVKNNDVLEFISGILGVPSNFLGQSMTIRQMQTSHGAKAGSTYSVPLNRRQAEASRDALAKAIYDRIFDWIIARINAALATTAEKALSIGVLDIYGFEVFKVNAFEQLCLAAGTSVALADGTAVPIEDVVAMHKAGVHVPLAAPHAGGLSSAEFIDAWAVGEKECVRLLFEDGRSLECTPDHRVMKLDGEFVEAQDIVLNETVLAVTSKIHEVTAISHNEHGFVWAGVNGEQDITMDSIRERVRAMAFARRLGYLYLMSTESQKDLSNLEEVEKQVVQDMSLLLRHSHTLQQTLDVNLSDFLASAPASLVREYEMTVQKQRYGGLAGLEGMKCVGREEIGKKEVFDVTVPKYQAFVANGVAVHNCINYINEKLQQIFIELTLKIEQEEYVKENIKWTPIKFFDNKIVCELIEAKNPPGIFMVLNDVCKSVHSADPDKPFMDRLNSCAANPHFQHRNRAFLIKHYAGDVIYEGYGMVEKNKDTLYKDLLEVIKLSSNSYLSSTLFPEEIDKNDKRMPDTAVIKITRQADRLVTTLMKSQPHYVRCIKPNDEKAQNVWNQERVMHQIVYLGLLDNLRVRRAGFAYRAPFKKFMERYYLISKQCSYAAKKIWKGDDTSGCTAIMKDNFIGPDQFQVGKTKVFIRHPEVLFGLEDARENYWHNISNRIKNCFLCYKNFNHELASRVKRAFRTYKRFRIAQVEVIQEAFREYKGAAPFYDRRMDTEKVIAGKKERQRLSLLSCRKFFGDYLNQNAARPIQDAMGTSERWVFSATGNTIFKNKISPRWFVLTEQAFYAVLLAVVKKVGVLQTERRIPLNTIEGVSMSPFGDNFLILNTDITDGDYVVDSPFKTELLAWLRVTKPNLRIGGFNDPKDPSKPIIHYKSKKVSQPGKTNAKIQVFPDLDALRLKLKAEPSAQIFFKSGKLYCLHALPASSSVKVITKQTGGPVVEAPAPIQITESRVLRGHVVKRGGGAKVAGLEAALTGKPAPVTASPAASSPVSTPAASSGAPARAKPAGSPAPAPTRAAPKGGAGGGPPKAAAGGGPPQRAAAGGPPKAAAGGGPPQRAAAGGPPKAAAGGGPPQRAAGGPPKGGAGGGPPQRASAGGPPKGGAGGAPKGGAGGGAPRRAGGGPAAPAKPQCRALFDFDAGQSDELSFREGDVLSIVSEDGDWYTAELKGARGLIPANYVEKI